MRFIRHTLLPLALIGITAVTAQAQVFMAGVRVGANIASASTDADVSAKTGLVLGALAQLQIWGPLNFRAEAQYAQKGGKFVAESSVTGPQLPSGNINLNYLDIPLNLTLKVGGSSFFVYGTAGTTVGTLLSAAADNTSQDVKSLFNPIDLSLDLGGGVGFEIAPHLSIVGDLLYSFGLTDAAKTNAEPVLNADSWKARNLKLTTGLYFTL